jgi:nucleotide-binding universal stress UspA family protein
LNYFVATDGSEAAHAAFEVVMESMLHPSDHLTVAHIYNNSKTFLPFDMKPEALKSKYQQLTFLMGTRANLLWEDNEHSGMSTKEQMVELAKKSNAGVLVVGLHGRKGPKE